MVTPWWRVVTGCHASERCFVSVLQVDCLRLHDAETPESFAQATAPGGAVDALLAMREEGTIKHISLSGNDAEYLLRCRLWLRSLITGAKGVPCVRVHQPTTVQDHLSPHPAPPKAVPVLL